MSPPTAYLNLLPAEIWIACWTLCFHRQLRRISLVCSVFRVSFDPTSCRFSSTSGKASNGS
ncbi:hypothetical protein B0H19DRAFT_1138296 [Mycena capillaripes]|nr:hypothetical protein B0H19DRAFT_1138296 [Mycena capillaripes]